MMKRVLTAILVLALMLSMVGCSGAADDSQGTAEEESTAAANGDTAVKESSGNDDGVTIRYMTWAYADRKTSIDAFIKLAKEKYNINIELENYPTTQYKTILKTKAAANELPELFQIHGLESDYVYPIFQQGYILPVDGLFDPEAHNPSAYEINTFDGQVYNLGYSSNAIGVIYNKGVFEEAGVSIPTNYAEFEAVCNDLLAQDITPLALSAKDSWPLNLITLLACGENILKDYGYTEAYELLKKGEIALDTPEMIDAVNVMLDFEEKGWFSKNPLGTDISAAGSMLANGEAAMMVMGSWQYNAISSANPDADISFFALPLNTEGLPTLNLTPPTAGLSINANADPEVMEAAKQAWSLYYSNEHLTLMLEDMSGIPMRKDVEVQSDFVNDVLEAIDNSVNTIHIQAGIPAGAPFQMPQESQNVFAGAKTPEDFAKEYQAALDEALGR